MQTKDRKHESSVSAALNAAPHRYRFAQLLNLLLRNLRRQGVSYERAFRDVIRFRNNLSLAYPPSEIQAVEAEPTQHIQITPAFIGLLGASGTLPLHETERIAGRKAMDGDASQHELIDLFSNRLIGLFYEAWGKYRVEQSIVARGQDRLLPMLAALAGAHPDRQPGDDSNRHTTAYYAGLLRTRPVSAGTVERVLSDHFGVPIQLEQLVGSWDPIPEARRSTLGTATPVLGAGAALGVRLWRHDLRARLHIGPLGEERLAQFLPGGAALQALAGMVKLFAASAVRYEIRLIPAPPCIKRLTLQTRAEPRRLGRNSFLTAKPGHAHKPEIRCELRLASGGGKQWT